MPSRVDDNQKQVTDDLRTMGYSVWLTHELGKGAPDMVVGKGDINLLVELKRDDKSKLNADEERFHSRWQGPIMVARSAGEVHAEMQRLLNREQYGKM